jgi:hypothetical protein
MIRSPSIFSSHFFNHRRNFIGNDHPDFIGDDHPDSAPHLPLTGNSAMKQRLSAEMRDTTSKSPIILHAADALRRARKLPVGAARNDLRQLARELRELHRIRAYASLQNVESPATGSEMR